MDKLLNEINAIRNNIGLKLITEEEYYSEKQDPSYWTSSKSWEKNDDTYTEPEPEEPNTKWKSSVSSNPVGKTADYQATTPTSGGSTYKAPTPSKPAVKVAPNALGIKGTSKLTQPGDINQIMQLMEYNQLGMLFEGYTTIFTEQKQLEAHKQLSEIIINNVISAINEAKKKAPVETTQGRAVANSGNSKFFKNLLTILPSEAITASISQEFEQQYGKKLNKVEIQKFLKELLTGLSGLSNAQMLDLIKRGGVRPKEYAKIINSLYDNAEPSTGEPTAEPEAPISNAAATATAPTQTTLNPQPMKTADKKDDYGYSDEPEPAEQPETTTNMDTFMPDNVGNYNLRPVKREARIAMAHKAVEILRRGNLPLDEENMLEAMRQLIDDINKSGKKRIPTTNGFS